VDLRLVNRAGFRLVGVFSFRASVSAKNLLSVAAMNFNPRTRKTRWIREDDEPFGS